MSHKVRARFRCSSVAQIRFGKDDNQKVTRISLSPVKSGPFWEATPGGHMEIDIANDFAAEFFKPSTEYFVDFVEVEDE